ncbi:ABC transporter substrate-binding protein [Paenibacillus sp. MY03]|uniref:ABC transporter substrate-binding protein n=1 Tax=Paenibacillus sp. MY03 TaxID=302980 RepID=UPI000B3C57D3|nr:ABC transporter substrate-binding protein [Paenibacillus sp. MY03]OUS71340.1 ABC transporter substrate-binding protein [Paenibacillus sp. MY03]
MNKSKTGAAGLLLSVALVLGACSGGNGGNAGNGDVSPEGSGNGGAPAERKVEEITVAFPIVTTSQQDLQLVEDAINVISEEKIQTKVKLLPINAGEWAQRMNLIFSGGEKLDLTFVSGTMYSNMVAKGQLIPLDELLDSQGEGIRTAVEEQYLNGTRIGGKSYAVPTVRDLAGSYGLTMRKDLVDKHGIDIASINTLDDVANVLKTIKAGEPNVVPLIPGAPGQSFRDNYTFYDPLGDHMGVLPDYDNGLKIVNLYETTEYKSFLDTIRQWYLDGYILPDAATNKTTTFELLKSGKAFGYLAMQKPGFAEQETKSSGVEMVTKELLAPVSTTTNVTAAMWGIPVHSKQQERAMDFLNLLYTDKDIVNLFDWGIEGTHYIKAEGGPDNVIAYPEGKDAASVGYNMLGWVFGNQFLSYVMKNGDPDIWNKTEAFNKSAKPSKALGFVFDASAVKTEVAAVSNVVTQYRLPLETGSVDPAKMLPEFVEKLKSAGLDKIIAEKQKQLDEWAKTSSAQ